MATTVSQIMDADPASIGVDDDVRAAIQKMRTHELPGLPVVDDDGRVAGIVTESDLVIRDEQADLHLPYFLNLMGGVIFLEPMKHFEDRVKKAVATRVSDLMTADPITVSPDDPAAKAARLIASTHHNRLPVVGSDGRLVGVVTRVDVLAAITPEE